MSNVEGFIETMDIFGRILIADPDETALYNLTDLLQREGYPCTSVRDGLEAIQALDANEYDLLITEIQMPGNEELELVQAARRHVEGLPVIIHTVHPSFGEAVQTMNESAGEVESGVGLANQSGQALTSLLKTAEGGQHSGEEIGPAAG